ncbi:hypothetical protein [Bacillus sp. FJAT-44742]|uniref:hypothetical protein n=1 Tax=Bacillus sp. FJAT-44742 TaxID=2014005 RepID=UPI000C243DF6|nr:hypothetical protein [Bacillus sp. FJAT-44742]
MNEIPSIYLALVESYDNAYDVYLVNNTEHLIDQANRSIGGQYDDDFKTSSDNLIFEFGPLGPYSSVKIDRLEFFDFQFVNPYRMTFVLAGQETKKTFIVSKYLNEHPSSPYILPEEQKSGYLVE